MTIEYLDSKRITTTPVTTSTNGTTADATNSSSGTSQVTGKVGNALDFSSGRYTIPKEATDFGNEWSFNFWVNPQSASGNDYFLHHTSASHVGSSFYMYNSDDDPSGSGGVMVNVRDSTNTKLTLDSSDNHIVFDINSLAGTWVMCTVTWNNSDKKLRLYQNGSLRATSKAWTHSSAGNMAVSGADWTIGNYQTQTGSTYSARSKFDEWSFWSTTLSQADITELYTGIKATELSNSTAISKLKIYYNFEQGANNTITNQAPTTVEQSKPTDVQDNSILIQKDTARRYWRSGEVSGSDTNTSQSTYNDDSGIDSSTGGWGARFNAGHALVGQEIRSIKVRMRCASSNTVNMTARLYGSTKATLRATSTAVSSSGLTSSYVDKTFVFPSGSRGVVQAGDHIMIVADSAVASSGGWNCQIKSGAGTNTHFTTWQGQSNAFTEQTTRELWYDPIVSGTFTAAAWNAPSKTPAEIGDLKVHYDATVGVTASSNSVSAWADQSGNGKTLSSVSNPTRVEAGQNGKDYIDFNSSKSMRASGLSEDAPRPFSMVIVINPRNTSDQSIIRWGQSPYLALYQYPVNTYYISGGSDVGLSDSTLDGSWNAFFMDFKSDADGGTLQINLDTANAVSGDIGDNGTSGSGSNSQPSTLHVGVNGTNNNWYANCRYAEIIIFDKVLTAYEKEQLYGHLKTKWGLP